MDFTFLEPDDERWQDVLVRSEHDIYHLPDYSRLLGEERGMHPSACYGESGATRLLMPLLIDDVPPELGVDERLRDGRSPDGYPGPLFTGDPSTIPAVLRSLTAFLKSERIVGCFVRPHPFFGLRPDAFEEIAEIVDHGPTVSVALDIPYPQILRNMRQGHRYEIRRASNAGYTMTFDRWERLSDFVACYNALMQRVEAAPSYRFSETYFRTFRRATGDGAHLALALNKEGLAAAGALFTLRGGVIQYHLAAGDPAFDKDAVQKFVVDGIIRWGLEQGALQVHLGGGVAARVDSLLKFKQGFGGSNLPYRTVRIVPDPEMLARVNSAWRTRNDGAELVSDFFPAYRATLPPGE